MTPLPARRGASGRAVGGVRGKFNVAGGAWATGHEPVEAAGVLGLPKGIMVSRAERWRAEASMEGDAGKGSEL